MNPLFKHTYFTLCLCSVFCIVHVQLLWGQETSEPEQGLLLQAQQQMQAYEYAAAIPILQKAIQADSFSIQSQWLLSQCYAHLGQTAPAKQHLNQVIALDPNHRLARALQAQLYLKESNYRKAAEVYDALLQLDSTNAYFFRQRAYVASKAGDAAAAIPFYQKALLLNPGDTETITEVAELWLRLQNTEEAASMVQQGLQLDSGSLRLWRLQAKLAYHEKEYSGVISAMARPLLAGDSALYYVQLLGISHFHLGNYGDAIHWLTYLEQQGMDTEVLYYYLGLSHRNAGDKTKGVVYLEKAAQKAVSDNLNHYYTQLASVYEEKGDYSNAIRAYQLAYKGSGNKKLLYHLARNYDQHYKDKRVALRYYQKYLAEVDTANANYQDYARYRATQLQEHMHFSLDSL